MPRISTRVMVDVDKTSSIEFPVEVRYHEADDCWVEGYIVVRSEDHEYLNGYSFSAKVYAGPSTSGINKGRICKLYVRDVSTNTEVIGYD